ncbi:MULTISPECIES: YbjQ family protein [Vitreoscilla]|uniref:YbjQ family protein n=1 Tax=Vitreoscilla stercoraria TaxID=61 RepID=A0ABY4E7Y5_VITST|nr:MULTISPECIES: heavy metal-binding domain-containing protein [Vitreoscilla]AUZ04892.1 hypothetical protein ADP71_12540 [Vitreoscilla sp. C1]UOO91453.1 YbjQ family protein [Vitreoscilla stercoraria]
MLLEIIVFLSLFGIGWFFGRKAERDHWRSLDEQEKALAHISIDTNKFSRSDEAGCFVSGNVVLANDYFKLVLANIRNFLGGRIGSYETVVERARREAILRVKQDAQAAGLNHIMGLRLITTQLTETGGVVEVLAYGTAVRKQ